MFAYLVTLAYGDVEVPTLAQVVFLSHREGRMPVLWRPFCFKRAGAISADATIRLVDPEGSRQPDPWFGGPGQGRRSQGQVVLVVSALKLR